jgi:hypothetical protein
MMRRAFFYFRLRPPLVGVSWTQALAVPIFGEDHRTIVFD